MKEILKKLRTENRYSQEMLAKILGISRQAYMKYESGEVEPTVEIVRKLSKIYKVSYEVLINNEICEQKEFKYKQEEKNMSFSYSSPEYNVKNQGEFIESFSETLDYLQNIISMMKIQLESLQNKSYAKTPVIHSFSKSRTFNKKDFFDTVGKQNIDSSYINELREESLI